MLKESILFVASTGLLIYLLTPSDEPVKTDPVPEEVQKVVTRAPQHSNDGWGNDESESEDETFVFGEPLVNLNGNYGDTASDDTDTARSAAFTDSREKPDGKGGVDDPIEFKPRASPNPTDR